MAASPWACMVASWHSAGRGPRQERSCASARSERAVRPGSTGRRGSTRRLAGRRGGIGRARAADVDRQHLMVCTVIKSLTTDVSGVPQSLSLDGRIETLEHDRDGLCVAGRRSSGRFPGGRRRVRQAGGLAQTETGAWPAPTSCVDLDRRLTPRRARVRLLLAPGPIAR
jgi:hypothetical protein